MPLASLPLLHFESRHPERSEGSLYSPLQLQLQLQLQLPLQLRWQLQLSLLLPFPLLHLEVVILNAANDPRIARPTEK
jgi:hypothetical protein